MHIDTRDLIADIAMLTLMALVLVVLVGVVVLGLLAGHPEPLVGVLIVAVVFGAVRLLVR